MQISGFLGTRGDIIVDTVMLASAALPFLLFIAIRFARKERYDLHKWSQITLITIVILLVIALELDIRFGGLYEVIEQSRYYGSDMLTAIFVVHLFFAVSSTLLWLWLIVISAKRYPVHFRFPHKKYGLIVFGDVVMTVITGWILYAMVFAG
ncbi:MAG TPA: DUF420 domain-containing protein [Campylobacteraceae bacterium]|nr:DUF420 domain-containing protein [Campylobacteraceae bacterium]